MDISIGSYSFHRLLESGKQDIFGYITDCKRLGCTQLDPWNGHLPLLQPEADQIMKGEAKLTADEEAWVKKVRAASDEAGVPFGCVAIDGGHIYEADSAARQKNRTLAYRSLDVANRLGASQFRIDTGGTPELPREQFDVIIEGYRDLIPRAKDKGLQILIENHWGACKIPDNLVRIFETLPDLKLLFDSSNWNKGQEDEGGQKCAKYAASVHIKTFTFDESGNDPTVDVRKSIRYLLQAGYKGCWGVESVPKDGDEYGAAAKTIALIKRVLNEQTQNIQQ